MTRSPKSDGGDPYRAAGVDIAAGNALVERIKPLARTTDRPGVASGLGGFGGLFDLAKTGLADPVLVASTDGVGTKLKLAIETGIHGTVGIDLVAMCVNDVVVQGAEPLFFLDYFATGALDVEHAAKVIEGIATGCREAGCALLGGETAEMPGLYARGDYDLAGFAVGAVERARLLPATGIKAGDVLVGLPASGLHSNGFSLVRKLIADRKLTLDGPAPFDKGRTLGAALLEPTRLYVRQVLDAHRAGLIKAACHITGGGLTENLPRILPERIAARIDLAAIAPMPVFAWLAQTGAIEEAALLRTFNCGIGMVLVTDEARAEPLCDRLRAFEEQPVRIGELVEVKAEPGAGVQYMNQLALGR